MTYTMIPGVVGRADSTGLLKGARHNALLAQAAVLLCQTSSRSWLAVL